MVISRQTLTEGVCLETGERLRIVVAGRVSCIRLVGMFFDTNKAFLLPSAMQGIRKLVGVYKEHEEGELLVVGHTDTTGEADINDPLSLERARSVDAFLRDDVDAWLSYYGTDTPLAARWGEKEDSAMLGALPDSASHLEKPEPFRSYQESRGLTVDGIVGPQTRRSLITDYMALDGTTLPKGIEPVPHGAGENFPDVATGDGQEDEANRRVEIFLFEDGIDPPPPGSNSGPGSNEYPQWREQSARTVDFSTRARSFSVRLVDGTGAPIPGAEWQALPQGAPEPSTTGVADENGVASIEIPVSEGIVTLSWSPPGVGAFHYRHDYDVQFLEHDSSADARLRNLGYTGQKEDAVRAFQCEHGLVETGILEDIAEALREWHDHGSRPAHASAKGVSQADTQKDEAFVAQTEDTGYLEDDDGHTDEPDELDNIGASP